MAGLTLQLPRNEEEYLSDGDFDSPMYPNRSPVFANANADRFGSMRTNCAPASPFGQRMSMNMMNRQGNSLKYNSFGMLSSYFYSCFWRFKDGKS